MLLLLLFLHLLYLNLLLLVLLLLLINMPRRGGLLYGLAILYGYRGSGAHHNHLARRRHNLMHGCALLLQSRCCGDRLRFHLLRLTIFSLHCRQRRPHGLLLGAHFLQQTLILRCLRRHRTGRTYLCAILWQYLRYTLCHLLLQLASGDRLLLQLCSDDGLCRLLLLLLGLLLVALLLLGRERFDLLAWLCGRLCDVALQGDRCGEKMKVKMNT